jgi:hypothetical protein
MPDRPIGVIMPAAAVADESVTIAPLPAPAAVAEPAYPGQDLTWLAAPPAAAGAGPAALTLHTLHDGRFCIGPGLDGVVLATDGTLVEEMARFSRLVRHAPGAQPPSLPAPTAEFEEAFIGFDAAWGNWFHFLCFALGRSALAEDLLGPGCRIVLPDPAGGADDPAVRFLPASWPQALEAAGLAERAQCLPAGVYRARRLRFFSTEPAPGACIVGLSGFQSVFTAMQSRLRRHPERPRRLLVARDRAGDPRLDQVETERLYRLAAAHGFAPTYFEAMDFGSQAGAVFNGDCLIGVHGAGLTNLLFARPGMRVLEINHPIGREPRPRPWFGLIAAARGLRYAALNRRAGELAEPILEMAIQRLTRAP